MRARDGPLGEVGIDSKLEQRLELKLAVEFGTFGLNIEHATLCQRSNWV